MRNLSDFIKRFFIVTIFVTCAVLFLVGSITPPSRVIVFITSLSRSTINAEIATDKKWYIKQYAEKLNRNEYTIETIYKYSTQFNIPFNFALAIGYQESGLIHYNPNRPLNKNINGSFDYGIFQLNSKTYPNVIDNYGTIEKNTKQGISHLALEYKKYNSFEISAMTYNCGNAKKVGVQTLDYLRNVLKYEKDLDEFVNSIYKHKISRDFSSGKI